MDFGRRNKPDAAFSMSSMTDLVFLLLIFFIIVSTLVSPYALPVDLPKSANKTKEKPKVSVRIDVDQNFSVNNEKIEPADLERVLVSTMSAQGEENAIVLHVDQAVPTGVTVGVMDIVKRNRWKLILATKPK